MAFPYFCKDALVHAVKKKLSEKSRIPIDLDDIILDLEECYSRISGIAKNSNADGKSFSKRLNNEGH